ncbi:DUF1559 domain-containing protein [Rubinisphaera italica]
MSIAIIAVLVSLLLPAVQQAREAARKMSCKNNLKQLSLGIIQYADIYSCYPPAYDRYDDDTMNIHKELWSWTPRILPFIEQADLYDQMRLDESIGFPSNIKPARTILPIVQCPSAPANRLCSVTSSIPGCEDMAETNYVCVTSTLERVPGRVGFRNGSGLLIYDDWLPTKSATDGLSSTILLTESDKTIPNHLGSVCQGVEYQGYIWGYFASATAYYGINNPQKTVYGDHIFSYHPGGANFSFADGHVKFISENIDQTLLEALTTRAGGEVIGEY